jgi:hypothetical protein
LRSTLDLKTHLNQVCLDVWMTVYRYPKYLQQLAMNDFIEKNEDTLNAKDLLASPRGLQYAGEHFHNSRKERKGTSRLYLPVAPQLLPEFRSLLQNRDYLNKQSNDAWMYFKICYQQAATGYDLCKLLPESIHSELISSFAVHVPEDVSAAASCQITDEKAEALKMQYAPYYEAILCRLADNLFLEVA